MRRNTGWLLFAWLVVGLASCASPSPQAGGGRMRSYAEAEGVRASARCYMNSEELFGAVLPAKGIYPVELTLAVREGQTQSVEIARGDSEMVLLLPDGTPLECVAAEEIFTGTPEVDDVIERRALRYGILDAGEQRTGFVFFRALGAEPEVDWKGAGNVSVRSERSERDLNLAGSLLGFGVLVGRDQRTPFRIGIEPRLWIPERGGPTP